MKASAVITKTVRIVCGIGLIIAVIFWSLVSVRLVAGFATGGVDGARGNLHHMILAGTLWGEIDRDPLVAISRRYESLVLWLLITWALRELYALAGKKLKLQGSTIR